MKTLKRHLSASDGRKETKKKTNQQLHGAERFDENDDSLKRRTKSMDRKWYGMSPKFKGKTKKQNSFEISDAELVFSTYSGTPEPLSTLQRKKKELKDVEENKEIHNLHAASNNNNVATDSQNENVIEEIISDPVLKKKIKTEDLFALRELLLSLIDVNDNYIDEDKHSFTSIHNFSASQLITPSTTPQDTPSPDHLVPWQQIITNDNGEIRHESYHKLNTKKLRDTLRQSGLIDDVLVEKLQAIERHCKEQDTDSITSLEERLAKIRSGSLISDSNISLVKINKEYAGNNDFKEKLDNNGNVVQNKSKCHSFDLSDHKECKDRAHKRLGEGIEEFSTNLAPVAVKDGIEVTEIYSNPCIGGTISAEKTKLNEIQGNSILTEYIIKDAEIDVEFPINKNEMESGEINFMTQDIIAQINGLTKEENEIEKRQITSLATSKLQTKYNVQSLSNADTSYDDNTEMKNASYSLSPLYCNEENNVKVLSPTVSEDFEFIESPLQADSTEIIFQIQNINQIGNNKDLSRNDGSTMMTESHAAALDNERPDSLLLEMDLFTDNSVVYMEDFTVPTETDKTIVASASPTESLTVNSNIPNSVTAANTTARPFFADQSIPDEYSLKTSEVSNGKASIAQINSRKDGHNLSSPVNIKFKKQLPVKKYYGITVKEPVLQVSTTILQHTENITELPETDLGVDNSTLAPVRSARIKFENIEPDKTKQIPDEQLSPIKVISPNELKDDDELFATQNKLHVSYDENVTNCPENTEVASSVDSNTRRDKNDTRESLTIQIKGKDANVADENSLESKERKKNVNENAESLNMVEQNKRKHFIVSVANNSSIKDVKIEGQQTITLTFQTLEQNLKDDTGIKEGSESNARNINQKGLEQSNEDNKNFDVIGMDTVVRPNTTEEDNFESGVHELADGKILKEEILVETEVAMLNNEGAHKISTKLVEDNRTGIFDVRPENYIEIDGKKKTVEKIKSKNGKSLQKASRRVSVSDLLYEVDKTVKEKPQLAADIPRQYSLFGERLADKIIHKAYVIIKRTSQAFIFKPRVGGLSFDIGIAGKDESNMNAASTHNSGNPVVESNLRKLSRSSIETPPKTILLKQDEIMETSGAQILEKTYYQKEVDSQPVVNLSQISHVTTFTEKEKKEGNKTHDENDFMCIDEINVEPATSETSDNIIVKTKELVRETTLEQDAIVKEASLALNNDKQAHQYVGDNESGYLETNEETQAIKKREAENNPITELELVAVEDQQALIIVLNESEKNSVLFETESLPLEENENRSLNGTDNQSEKEARVQALEKIKRCKENGSEKTISTLLLENNNSEEIENEHIYVGCEDGILEVRTVNVERSSSHENNDNCKETEGNKEDDWLEKKPKESNRCELNTIISEASLPPPSAEKEEMSFSSTISKEKELNNLNSSLMFHNDDKKDNKRKQKQCSLEASIVTDQRVLVGVGTDKAEVQMTCETMKRESGADETGLAKNEIKDIKMQNEAARSETHSISKYEGSANKNTDQDTFPLKSEIEIIDIKNELVGSQQDAVSEVSSIEQNNLEQIEESIDAVGLFENCKKDLTLHKIHVTESTQQHLTKSQYNDQPKPFTDAKDVIPLKVLEENDFASINPDTSEISKHASLKQKSFSEMAEKENIDYCETISMPTLTTTGFVQATGTIEDAVSIKTEGKENSHTDTEAKPTPKFASTMFTQSRLLDVGNDGEQFNQHYNVDTTLAFSPIPIGKQVDGTNVKSIADEVEAISKDKRSSEITLDEDATLTNNRVEPEGETEIVPIVVQVVKTAIDFNWVEKETTACNTPLGTKKAENEKKFSLPFHRKSLLIIHDRLLRQFNNDSEYEVKTSNPNQLDKDDFNNTPSSELNFSVYAIPVLVEKKVKPLIHDEKLTSIEIKDTECEIDFSYMETTKKKSSSFNSTPTNLVCYRERSQSCKSYLNEDRDRKKTVHGVYGKDLIRIAVEQLTQNTLPQEILAANKKELSDDLQANQQEGELSPSTNAKEEETTHNCTENNGFSAVTDQCSLEKNDKPTEIDNQNQWQVKNSIQVTAEDKEMLSQCRTIPFRKKEEQIYSVSTKEYKSKHDDEKIGNTIGGSCLELSSKPQGNTETSSINFNQHEVDGLTISNSDKSIETNFFATNSDREIMEIENLNIEKKKEVHDTSWKHTINELSSEDAEDTKPSTKIKKKPRLSIEANTEDLNEKIRRSIHENEYFWSNQPEQLSEWMKISIEKNQRTNEGKVHEKPEDSVSFVSTTMNEITSLQESNMEETIESPFLRKIPEAVNVEQTTNLETMAYISGDVSGSSNAHQDFQKSQNLLSGIKNRDKEYGDRERVFDVEGKSIENSLPLDEFEDQLRTFVKINTVLERTLSEASNSDAPATNCNFAENHEMYLSEPTARLQETISNPVPNELAAEYRIKDSIRCRLTNVESSNVVVESSDVVIESSDVVVESSENVVESSDVVIESSDVVVESSDVVVESSDVVVEPSDVVVEPSDVVVESSEIVVESSEVVVESLDVVVELTDAVLESSEIVVESSEVEVESSDVVVELTDAVLESSDVVVKSSDVVVESSDVIEPSDVVIEPSDVDSEHKRDTIPKNPTEETPLYIVSKDVCQINVQTSSKIKVYSDHEPESPVRFDMVSPLPIACNHVRMRVTSPTPSQPQPFQVRIEKNLQPRPAIVRVRSPTVDQKSISITHTHTSDTDTVRTRGNLTNDLHCILASLPENNFEFMRHSELRNEYSTRKQYINIEQTEAVTLDIQGDRLVEKGENQRYRDRSEIETLYPLSVTLKSVEKKQPQNITFELRSSGRII